MRKYEETKYKISNGTVQLQIVHCCEEVTVEDSQLEEVEGEEWSRLSKVLKVFRRISKLIDYIGSKGCSGEEPSCRVLELVELVEGLVRDTKEERATVDQVEAGGEISVIKTFSNSHCPL